MQVLYTQADGSKLVYEREDKEIIYGYVIRPNGKQYQTMPVESILARGYWEVAEEFAKHLQGQHDQRTHGSWSGGGAGVDITDELNTLFYDGNEPKFGDNKPNDDSWDLLKEMKETEMAAGRGYGDNALKIIAERQGFTDKPKTVENISELQDIQKTEGGTLVYRGIADYSLFAATGSGSEQFGKGVSYTAEQAVLDFREGEYFAGWGMFGNGTYTTVDVEMASGYASSMNDDGAMGNGKTMAMLIPKNVKMPTAEDISSAYDAMIHDHPWRPTHRNDMGRYLAAKGFQAWDVGLMQDDKAGVIVVLDRSMLTVAVQAVEDQ